MESLPRLIHLIRPLHAHIAKEIIQALSRCRLLLICTKLGSKALARRLKPLLVVLIGLIERLIKRLISMIERLVNRLIG